MGGGPLNPSWFSLILAGCVLVVPLAAFADDTGPAAADRWRPGLWAADMSVRDGRLSDAASRYRELLAAMDAATDVDARSKGECLRSLANVERMLGRHADEIAIRKRYQEFLATGNDDVRQRMNLAAAANACEAIGDLPQAEGFLRAMLDVKSLIKLHPVPKIEALAGLARLAAERGDVPEAKRRWETVRAFGQRMMTMPRNVILDRERLLIARQLVKSHVALEEPQPAIDVLGKIVELCRSLPDEASEKDALLETARIQQSTGLLQEAERTLLQAVAKQTIDLASDELAAGDCLRELAAVQRKLNQVENAKATQERATEQYRAVIRGMTSKPQELSRAYRALLDMARAGNRTEEEASLLADWREKIDARSFEMLDVSEELAAATARLGDYPKSRQLLDSVLQRRRQEEPVRDQKLAKTLVQSAALVQTLGEFDHAEALVNEASQLCSRHSEWPAKIKAETANCHGHVLAGQGRYAEAFDRFRVGRAECAKAGGFLKEVDGALLLNMALAAKAQGQLDNAEKYLREAIVIRESIRGSDEIELAGYWNALAGLCIARREPRGAVDALTQALAILKQNNREDDPIAANSYHHLALMARKAKDYRQAREYWNRALAIQKQAGQSALAVRTLNHLGRIATLEGDAAEAERHFREALRMHDWETDAYVIDGFLTRYGLAECLRLQGKKNEASEQMQHAIRIIEAPRASAVGGDDGRATFLGQFGRALDSFVDWSLEDGNIEAAFQFAETARNRTFVDQLVEVDRGRGDQNVSSAIAAAIERERLAAEKCRSLRANLRTQLELDRNTPQRHALRDAIEAADREFDEARNALVDATFGRQLSVGSGVMTLRETLERSLEPGQVMLMYCLGHDHSHLLLLSRDREPEWFRLEVGPRGVDLDEPAAGETDPSKAGSTRAPVATIASSAGNWIDDDETASSAASGPLTREIARRLVEAYCETLTAAGVHESRAPNGVVSSSSGSLRASSANVVAEILLPAKVRQRIRELSAASVVIVADGALHRLPFEGLLIEDGAAPKYLADEFPPIAYAPSATVYARIVERNNAKPAAKPTVLTAGNPQYRTTDSTPPQLVSRQRDGVSALFGPLTPLPGSAAECRRIANAFAGSSVTLLDGAAANEANVCAAIAGKRYVHLAAHGLAEERHGNLFGGIALSAGTSDEQVIQDGLLTLYEIQSLPLRDCELAALSACQTNVGPIRPYEADSSLARAFLVAGTRRVVASHWNVSDESTAVLMGRFFENISVAEKSGGRVDYAAALQQARQEVRANPNWRSPYHWAPFVLIGPPASIERN